MHSVYVIAAEGGHVRIVASSRLDDDLRMLRRTYRMAFDLAYGSRPTPRAAEIARGARQALAGAAVAGGWFDTIPTAAVTAIAKAAADLGMRLEAAPRDEAQPAVAVPASRLRRSSRLDA